MEVVGRPIKTSIATAVEHVVDSEISGIRGREDRRLPGRFNGTLQRSWFQRTRQAHRFWCAGCRLLQIKRRSRKAQIAAMQVAKIGFEGQSGKRRPDKVNVETINA